MHYEQPRPPVAGHCRFDDRACGSVASIAAALLPLRGDCGHLADARGESAAAAHEHGRAAVGVALPLRVVAAVRVCVSALDYPLTKTGRSGWTCGYAVQRVPARRGRRRAADALL
jgi:hypothetical protein